MEKLYSLFQISEIIAKEKTGTLSSSDRAVLEQWISESPKNSEVYKKLQDENLLAANINELNEFDTQKAFAKVEQKTESKGKSGKTVRFIPVYLRYAAAIAALVVCSYVVFHLYQKPQMVQFTQSTIVAGKQRAILITAGNRQIQLDSSETKQIIQDASANIERTGSTLKYSNNMPANIAKAEIAYNTLITPRGGEYSLILSDGTEVMLNSGSRLRYPVVFAGNTREVELEGEAFFKVAKSLTSAFIVKANKVNIKVYGTVFNVSAYGNENIVQTTLVEGSVGVSIPDSRLAKETKLKPGQQLSYNKEADDKEIKEVNTDQYIAWTKGMFVFENEAIENILRVMSRWYDFKYEFSDEILKNQRFTVSVGRYDDVAKILDMISISSNIKFSAKGNSITIYSE